MGMPWLTVVLPTYNGCPHLVDALGSLCRQECNDFCVIAIDDGSTDETRKILAEYSNKLPLRIIERAHEGNWLANTNVGMSLADGRYVGWLHQDDLWEPERVGTLKSLAEEFPAAPMLFHPSWYIDDLGVRRGVWRCPLGRKTAKLDANMIRRRLLVQNFMAASAVVFRRETIEQIGPADDNLWYTGDWDFWLKLLGLGDPVYYPNPLSSFRVHNRSQTNNRLSQIGELQRQYEIMLARHLHDSINGCRIHTRTETVARFSVEANLFMIRCATGCRQGTWRLLFHLAALGPIGSYVFLRDSRIVERVAARVRASSMRPRTEA